MPIAGRIGHQAARPGVTRQLDDIGAHEKFTAAKGDMENADTSQYVECALDGGRVQFFALARVAGAVPAG